MKVPWCEYWEFLDAVVDVESADGLQRFEVYLQQRLKELIDKRAAEKHHQELLQNTSLCQLMHLLNLSDSSLLSSSRQDSDVLSEVQSTVCMTWPPSLAKLQPHDNDADRVIENSLSKEVKVLPSRVPDVCQLSGSNNSDELCDSLSACSSDSFHTADDDSDFEYDQVSDWPDGFDWQAVEPMFIHG